jgi:NtrC-family two-component system sensor histidine kinase KinB
MPDSSPDVTRSALELLYHISRELAAAIDLRSVLQRILSLSLANVGGERGSLVVLDDRMLPIDAAIIVGTRLLEHTAQQLRSTVDRGLAGWVVRNLQPVLIPDTSRDSRWLRRPDDAQEKSGAKSAICVPLLARERLVGVLTLVHQRPGFFNTDHLSLVQSIADMAGVAVMNARLYEDSRRQARVMTALAENAYTLNTSLRLDQVLQRILDQTAQAIQAEDVLLGLIDEVHRDLVFRAATGKSTQVLLGKRVPLGQGIAGRVALDGRGVLLPVVNPANMVQLPGVEVHSLMCAPVNAHGRIIGALQAINPTSENLGSEALLVLTGIGSLAGTAIHNAQLYEQLEVAHQRYRELFEGSIDPIFITDWKGKILEANRQANLTTGFDQAALQNQNISTLHQVNTEKAGENFLGIQKAGNLTYESTLSTLGGKVIPVEVYVQPISVDGENYLQWILRDITERKNLAILQDDLISMVYHDLRSPLANVISSLDLLHSLLPIDRSEELKSVLSIASNSTDRMQRLVNSLLDIRRLEAGQPITNREKISPYLLAADAVDAARFMATGRHQEISIELPEKLPDLFVDVDMIRRVLINLIENACKFTPAQGKVQVGAIRDGNWVQMWVKDSGPGIPPADQERIFDKYTRLQTPGSPKGLGLGLAFCRLAVNAHQGKIWVVSQPQSGSQFLLTLPAAEEKG